MASASSAYSTKAGYNQNGGAYYLTVGSGIPVANFLTYSGGSNSGGATTVGSFATYTYATDGANNTSSLINAAGKVLRDMGKTVVSAGRTFRKFQAVIPQTLSTVGITGQPAGTVNPGYLTGYLELPREGSGGVINAIARLG